jgi:hypothetical protein
MYPVTAAVILALTFYLIFPFLGALSTRKRWRTFRRRIIASSYVTVYPEKPRGPGGAADPDDGVYRFFGELEALEDRDTIWLSDGSHRVRVDLSDIRIFVLPAHNLEDRDPMADNSPTVTRWKNLGSLPEGTEFFVFGRLDAGTLVPAFRDADDCPLLVVIHDMPREMFLSRAIRTGRQRNEFWNSISPYSLLSGVMVQLLLILSLLQRDANSTLLFIMVPLALLPGIILAPPGVFLYFLYRNAWRRGRKYREERDLLRLPFRYRDNILPDGGRYLPQNSEGLPADFLDDGDLRFRHVMAEDPSETEIWSYHAHGSDDPFAEQVYIKGDPARLAEISQHRAVLLEYRSLFFFALGVGVNVLIIEFLMLLLWF